jgi:hypothetical protein
VPTADGVHGHFTDGFTACAILFGFL